MKRLSIILCCLLSTMLCYATSTPFVDWPPDEQGYALLTLTGKMPGSSVYKYILGATLYGGVGLSGAKDEEGLDDEDEIEE